MAVKQYIEAIREALDEVQEPPRRETQVENASTRERHDPGHGRIDE